MKYFRKSTIYVTDLLLVMIGALCLTSIFIYSSLINKTDLRVLELEGKMKVLEKVLEKKWLDKLDVKPKKHRKIM